MKRPLTIAAMVLLTAWSVGCVEVSGPVFDDDPWQWPFWDDSLGTVDTSGFVRTDVHWRGHVAPGDQIEIKGVYGDIRSTRTSGNEVVVTATKFGRPADLPSVTIESVPHANGITICAVYPDRPGQPPNECAPGDHGNMSVRDNGGRAVRVSFVVHVPDGVVFVGKTVGGDAEAVGLEGDAFVRTVAGDVRVSTTGLAAAQTVTGAIVADMGLADWGRDLEFLTVTGDIVVTIPSNTNARVQATTAFGLINSDFPLAQHAPGDMRGTIGSGGPGLRMVTTNGDITLRRGL